MVESKNYNFIRFLFLVTFAISEIDPMLTKILRSSLLFSFYTSVVFGIFPDSDVYRQPCSERYCYDFMNPCCVNSCFSPVSGLGPVDVAPCYSVDMLSRLHYRSVKPLVLLNYLRYNSCVSDVILSAQLRPSAFYAHACVADKFGYLGRFPTDFRGKNASVADIHDFTIAVTYSPLSWVHGYWEFLHSDQITFSTDPRQGANHTQKVYALLGDFNCSPVFLTIGKRDVSFGQMYTVNPFSPSVTWHYFGPLADGVAIGYYDRGLYFEGTLLNGGRGIRVSDTNEKGRLDNWALNATYEFQFCNLCMKVGGGYLYSTIYDGTVPEHTGPVEIGPRNGIWDVNIEFRYCQWRSYFEFASTERVWPSSDHKVRTLAGGISYCFRDCCWNNLTVLSLDYSEGVQGFKGDEWRRNFQFVTGVDYRIRHNVRFCFEYVLSGGFAPLIGLTDPGVSVQRARENLFQIGLTINI